MFCNLPRTRGNRTTRLSDELQRFVPVSGFAAGSYRFAVGSNRPEAGLPREGGPPSLTLQRAWPKPWRRPGPSPKSEKCRQNASTQHRADSLQSSAFLYCWGPAASSRGAPPPREEPASGRVLLATSLLIRASCQHF